jgi:hypothetical protein
MQTWYDSSRKEAFTAAKARAAGKNREEIRRLYLAELHARNLQIPDDHILDAAVDSIPETPSPPPVCSPTSSPPWARRSINSRRYSPKAAERAAPPVARFRKVGCLRYRLLAGDRGASREH